MQKEYREIIKPFHFTNEVIEPYTFIDYGKPHVGETHKTNQGDEVMVISYNKAIDMRVQFQDGFGAIKNAEYSKVLKGGVRNPCHINKYGGYMGIGQYDPYKYRYIYDTWSNMLDRNTEHGRITNIKNESYVNSNVCKEWHNFQNFAHWYLLYLDLLSDYAVNNIKYQLDKDIIQWNQPNKIYSPWTCCLIPPEINSLFIGMHKYRKSDLPIGVNKYKNRYESAISMSLIENRRVHLGYFGSVEEAFNAYKEAKKKYIKDVASKYYRIGAITDDIYKRLCNLEILSR